MDKLKILKLNHRLRYKSLEEIFESSEKTTREYLEEFGFSKKIIERFFKPFFAGIFLESELRTSSRMFEFVYKMFGEGYATIPKLGIGEISSQLKSKLNKTKFIFNCEVERVTNDSILLRSGKKQSHQGVIIASDASSVISNMNGQDLEWKSCTCLYFEVDKTNIPIDTIALVADANNQSNNMYAYTDTKTGKNILSVTALEVGKKSDKELIHDITAEVKKYTGALKIKYIQLYKIDKALPDIQNIRMTAQSSESQLLDNVFLAGDYLFNGSLNAAMESGRLAAHGLLEKKQGTRI
jgi:protoporphyrinogen oxidase